MENCVKKQKLTPSDEELQKYKKMTEKICKIFKQYYRQLLNMNPREEKDFKKSLVNELPITFRINKLKYSYYNFN